MRGRHGNQPRSQTILERSRFGQQVSEYHGGPSSPLDRKLLTAASDAKTILQNLKRECLRIGADLNLEKWHIIAPEGHVFNATECHYIVFERWKEDRSPRWGKASEGWNKIERKAAYQDALERLKLGISPDSEK
jgi:hypothetical protein